MKIKLILIFLLFYRLNALEIFVYKARFLNAHQLAEITSPFISHAGTINTILSTNQVVFSDTSDKIAEIKKRIELVDKPTISSTLDDLLSSHVNITATLEVNSAPSMSFSGRFRCGETVRRDNYEKVLYKTAALKADDQYLLCGAEISLTPRLDRNQFLIKLEYKTSNIVGYSNSGNPVTDDSVRTMVIASRGHETSSVKFPGEENVVLHLKIDLEEYLD